MSRNPAAAEHYPVARFDQQYEDLRQNWIPLLNDIDQPPLADALAADRELTHHVHELMNDLLPHQSMRFLLGVSRHVQNTPPTDRKAILAGLHTLAGWRKPGDR